MVALFAATAIAADRGILCVSGAECREAACRQRVPVDGRRTFTFTTGETTTLGVLTEDAPAVSCEGFGELTVRLATKLPKRAIALLTISSANGDAWELKLDADQLRKPAALRVRPGTYRVQLSAPHFITARATTTVANRPAVAALTLQPAPTLSAVIRDRRSRAPLPGALVTTDGSGTAVSDLAGRVSLEPDSDNWPHVLTITAAGYASATVAVPPAHAARVFDDILLGRGGTIAVELTRSDPSRSATIELNKLPSGAMVAGPAVHAAEVHAGEQTAKVRFENIEPGDYTVLIKGEGPCERRGAIVNVLDGEVKELAIDLVAVNLHVRARYQQEPLRETSIRLRNIDGRWEGKFKTDADGEATVQLWQGGPSSISLGVPTLFTAPYTERRELPEREDVEWLLDVPAREITGSIVDAATGAPIPGARVLLETKRGDGGGLSSRTQADDQGRFRYAPAAYGAHKLTALAKGYLPAEVTYTFAEPEERRELTVRMDAASSAKVAVVDSRGAPVAGARLAVFRGFELVVWGATDDSGIGEIPMPVAQPYDVYAIPRDGSFGVGQVAPDSTTITTLRLPDGVSRIVVKSESESHQPIPRVVLLIRYNGRLLPDAVLKAIGDLQGVRIWTGADGVLALDRMPAGLYEFWPVGSIGAPSAKVIAVPGENVAVVTFAPAH